MYLGKEIIINENEILKNEKKKYLNKKYLSVAVSFAAVFIIVFSILLTNYSKINIFNNNNKSTNSIDNNEYINNNEPDNADNTFLTKSNTHVTETPTPSITPTENNDDNSLDNFNITMLNPTIKNGREWYNNWNEGSKRTYTWNVDKFDKQLLYRGNGEYTIYGENSDKTGQIKVKGEAPRIFVRNDNIKTTEELYDKWLNVEVTFYVKTISYDDSMSYSGVSALVRTNYIQNDDLCGMSNYAGRMLFNGIVDFEKEVVYNEVYKSAGSVDFWGENKKMPLNKWVGYKLIARNSENNTKVSLELYCDTTDGENGGEWEHVTSFTDYKGWSKSDAFCSEEQNGMPLLEANNNVLISADGIEEQYYKNFSIREIEPLK
jgi:hypothetical protein